MTDSAALLSPPAGASKRELRAWARAARAHVRAESGPAVDEAVRAAVRASELYRQAEVVALYLPMGDEVDVLPLLQDGKRFVAPRMRAAPTPTLSFHEVRSSGLEAQLERHPWGVRQPLPDAPLAELHEIDLMLVPGLLFDRYGGRIGYGKGYYDRFLAPKAAPPPAALGVRPALPVTVGVAYEALVVPALPTGAHDVAVEQIVSEAGFRQVMRRAPR